MKTQSLLNLFDLYLQITSAMVPLDQINIVPLVALHNRSVRVNVQKFQNSLIKDCFSQSQNSTFYLLCQFVRLFLIVIGKKKQLLQF